MTEVVDRVYARKKRHLIKLDLDDIPEIYPIKVPVYIDRRAAADRADDPRVSALAKEIVDANPNAVVISNGVTGIDRVITFQAAKGRNDLIDNDVYIIVTNLAPEQYAELNAIGRWLDIPDVIELFYENQINQAVGRNRGFRESSSRQTKTVLITSNRLHKSVIAKVGNDASRTRLYQVAQKPW